MEELFAKTLGGFLKTGSLELVMPGGRRHFFGDGAGSKVTVAVASKAALRRMLANPTLGFAECFVGGDIDVLEGDLLDVIRIAFINGNYETSVSPLSRIGAFSRRVFRRLQQVNTPGRARGNVRAHYDLSEALYRLFLDDDMQYSCAYFESADEPLAEAQIAKMRHIAAKLLPEDNQHVLDIGSGWGGLGLYLARHCKSSITGVTLSEEQLRVARERARAAGLSASVDFRLEDYRMLDGTFDRIVSVGMFEHVGVNHYRTYFDKAAELLKPGGVMLLHTIGRSGPPAATDPFIRKYIFPGGYIPSLSELLVPIEKSGLVVTDVEMLRLHYAETLKAWRQRFLSNRDQVKVMYDERFCRMWELYLAGSEASFRWGDLVVFQLQIARDKAAVPMTRAYLGEKEKQLRRSEKRHDGRMREGAIAAE